MSWDDAISEIGDQMIDIRENQGQTLLLARFSKVQQ